MIYLQLFFEFFKTGLFAIGGGLATLPFLYDMSDRLGWFAHADVLNMLAISESTPGPIGVNMATNTGFATCSQVYGTLGGILGAIVAMLGLITPSIIIILLIAGVIQKFRKNFYVDAAFYSLRPTSTALIAAAGFSVMLACLFNTDAGFGLDFFKWPAILLAVILWIFTNKVPQTKDRHPIVFIAVSAVVGVLFRFGGV